MPGIIGAGQTEAALPDQSDYSYATILMTIRYTTSLDGITSSMLEGFLQTWRSPPPPEKLLRMLRASAHVILAIDDEHGRVVGLINAITDGVNFAFIPLLEVLSEYRGRGIGSQLVQRMLRELQDYPCIDLTCDPETQPFYEKCGMRRSTGMVIRDHSRSGPGKA